MCRLDAACAVDMRQMPPSVAEVYVLAMVAALKRATQRKYALHLSAHYLISRRL